MRDRRTRTAPSVAAALSLVILVLGSTGPTQAATAGADAPARREVYGFLTSSALAHGLERVDWSVISTIAYFGLHAGPDGRIERTRPDGTPNTDWVRWSSRQMTELIALAHAHRAKVHVGIERFAWSSEEREETIALLSDRGARRRLAREIAGLVQRRGVDGVNLDFEPIPIDVKDDYVTFVRELRVELDARVERSTIVFDATGLVTNYDVRALTRRGAADAVLVMGYAFRGYWSPRAGSVAPLHRDGYDVTDAVDAYMALTSPRKIILGVPYYAHAWSTRTDAKNSLVRTDTETFGAPATTTYERARELAVEHGRHYDAVEQVAWTVFRTKVCEECRSTWRQVYYDSERALARKYDLVNARDLRGVGIWALGFEGERTELNEVLRDKFGSR
jgi:spore germination protein YaaH